MNQAYPGKIHIGIDGWTSPNTFSYLGIMVHHAVEGHIQEFILDFIKCIFIGFFLFRIHFLLVVTRLTKGHTGVYLAQQLAQCLHEFKINAKVSFSCSLDIL